MRFTAAVLPVSCLECSRFAAEGMLKGIAVIPVKGTQIMIGGLIGGGILAYIASRLPQICYCGDGLGDVFMIEDKVLGLLNDSD